MRVDEITLENAEISTKYGTTCRDIRPPVVYIKAKTKITPMNKEKISFEGKINSIKNHFREYIEALVKSHESFDNTFIFNIEISSKNIAYKKLSNLKFDLYVKPKTKQTLVKYKTLIESLSAKINSFIIDLLKENNIKIA